MGFKQYNINVIGFLKTHNVLKKKLYYLSITTDETKLNKNV